MTTDEVAEENAQRYAFLCEWLVDVGLLRHERGVKRPDGQYGDCWVLWRPHSIDRERLSGWGDWIDAAIDRATGMDRAK